MQVKDRGEPIAPQSRNVEGQLVFCGTRHGDAGMTWAGAGQGSDVASGAPTPSASDWLMSNASGTLASTGPPLVMPAGPREGWLGDPSLPQADSKTSGKRANKLRMPFL